MRKIQILKEAVVMQIAVVMVFSSIAVANTNEIDLQTMSYKSQYKIKQSQSKEIGKLLGPIIWDNGGQNANSNLFSSQLDTCYPFVSQVADDFYFEGTTPIWDVHWWGGFWGSGEPINPLDFWIYFYSDDGTGNAPTGGGMGDPSPTALASYFCPSVLGVIDANGFYEYEVQLENPFFATGGHKYWIAIQAVFCYPPQWGWANTAAIRLHSAVQGFPLLNVPFWTTLSPAVDMAWYLTGEKQCEPSIDVEKYVKDRAGIWQDADTENEAVDLPICTNVTFKIVIKNTGDCPLIVSVDDKMHDSLKYIGADPKPYEVTYEPPFYYITWVWTAYIQPNQTIEIIVTAHVEGPACSIDYNYVHVKGQTETGAIVEDDDYAYVHAVKKSKSLNMPLINFLQSYTNLFRILQKLLQLGI